MPLNLRLEHGGAYSSDIENICRKAREVRAKRFVDAVDVSLGDSRVRLFSNLSYSCNHDDNVSASLYIIGFRNCDGINYRFNDPNFAGMILGNPQIFHASNGSYSSLGYGGGFNNLKISSEKLRASIDNVSNYRGGDDIRTDLTRLIIASSEAVRSCVVLKNVESVLQAPHIEYMPQSDWDVIHEWGGMSLAR